MKGDSKRLAKVNLESDKSDVGLPSYDIIGDIAVVRFPEAASLETTSIAEALMQRHRRVKTVLRQVGAVTGDLRLRKFEWVKGENNCVTIHKEFGCVFKVDIRRCYFSPRLSHERMRITRLVKANEVVVNMFAGVGSFSILVAKHSPAERIYSIDINLAAVKLMQENARLNRVEHRVVSILGDAQDVIAERLRNVADRVVMPLPRKAYAYLEYAVGALKRSGGWIHYYDFEHAYKAEDPVEKVKARVSEKLRSLGVSFTVSFGRVVRSTGPNWYQVVLDVYVNRKCCV